MATPTNSPARLDFVDNLRSVMVMLVVVFHAVITYSHIGSWYFSDPCVPNALESAVFGFFEMHCQAFFMGLLFFLAGYFVPESCDRKGTRRFTRDRLFRLGLPSLVYIMLIQPFILHGLLRYGDGGWLAYYRNYILSGRFLSGNGPMWFAIALLVFSLVYAAYCKLGPQTAGHPRIRTPGWNAILLTGLVVGFISFAVRLVQPIGTSVLNMQLCFFPQYIAMFVAGVVAYRNDWLRSLSNRSVGIRLTTILIISPLVVASLLFFSGFPKTGLTPYFGGWQWSSFGYAVWEQTFGFVFSVILLVVFREYFNRSGTFQKIARDNSFGIYFLHPPVVIAVCQLFVGVHWPLMIKAVVTGFLSVGLLLALVHFVVRRIPGVKKLV